MRLFKRRKKLVSNRHFRRIENKPRLLKVFPRDGSQIWSYMGYQIDVLPAGTVTWQARTTIGANEAMGAMLYVSRVCYFRHDAVADIVGDINIRLAKEKRWRENAVL